MKLAWIFISSIFLLISISNCQRTFLDHISLRPAFRWWRERVFNMIRSPSPDEAFKINLKMGRLQPQIPKDQSFFCDVNGPGKRSSEVPTSVHKLRPGDIDIIGALGDSLTAGNGGMATNILQTSIESKGVSFSIGGERTWREFLTIPNILKEFNPKLYGYSVLDGLSFHKTSKFNTAELGAMSRDTPHMAKVLVQRINSDENVKPEHWKLITYMIGPNDFCLDMCHYENPEEIVANHEKDLMSVFRTIRDSLNRTMLNVSYPPTIRTLLEFKGKPSECVTLHHFECPCFTGFRYTKYQKRFLQVIENWKKKVAEVVNRDEFHDREDFTINLQPFVDKIDFPTLPNGLTDFSYMSFDCFHLSQKGYALVSNALWNNMLEPVGNKSHNWKNIFEQFNCPTEERPYLATKFN